MTNPKDTHTPIAIATSDWHFWHTPPVWRSNEANWLNAMGRQLDQIVQASYKYNVPILNAGDIFDHFNPSPETINFIEQRLQNWMYAIPGQHDLEHHVLQNLNKTGFRTLMNGFIRFSENPNRPIIDEHYFEIYFAPWGTDIRNIEPTKNDRLKILLAHQYVWFDDSTKYGGQDIPAGKLSGFKETLQKFDFAIFGDNHIPFRKKIGRCQVINCGTMVRRKLDEKDYATGYTMLFDDKHIEFVPFDISKDINLEVKIDSQDNSETLNISSRKFMEELQAMEQGQIDYQTEIERKVKELNREDMQEQFGTIFENYGGKK